MELDRRSPVYEQIMQYFKEQIACGEFPPGSTVPSRRDLASRLKVNPNTVQRAYKEMEEMGLIHTEGNSPSTITENRSLIQEIRMELITRSLNDFLHAARKLGLGEDEAVELVRSGYEGGERHD